MTTCKQLEKSYIDYVCDLLDDEQYAVIQEHLRRCPACAREINTLQKVVSLTEDAREVAVPSVILDDIEMNVYKRLVVESPRRERASFFSRLFARLPLPAARYGSAWILRGAIATFVLGIAIPIATIFLDRDPSPEVSVSGFPVQTSQERIEQYRQKEIQISRDEALETMHLKGEDRTLQLRYFALAQHDRNQ